MHGKVYATLDLAKPRIYIERIMRNQGLKQAAKAAGSVIALAKQCGVTRAAIYKWDEALVPIPRMFQIEKKYGVRREDLRPDLFAGRERPAE
jgi:hypothetical protein